MPDLLLLREASVLIASGAGAYTDWKTGYIYDWVTLPLIVFGFALNVLEQNYFGIVIGVLVFVAGYLLYYTGKIGGGDVKLYAGISIALPTLQNGVYIASAFVFSSISAIVFISVFYALKYARKGIDVQYNREGIIRAAAITVLVVAYTYFLTTTKLAAQSFVFLFLLLGLCASFFIALEKGIRKEFFLKKVKVNELEEDEVIALEFMGEEERNKLQLGPKGVVGEKEKRIMQEKGVKEVLVYRDLPRMGPFIFIGAVLAMLFPDLQMLVMG